MDNYTGKRAGGGVVGPRKESNVFLRDKLDTRDRNAQFCNRVGCSGRLSYAKGPQIGRSEKAKSLRPTFRSSNGKEIAGSSSKICSVVTNSRQSFQVPRKKLTSKAETCSSESSNSVQDESEFPGVITSGISTSFQLELKDVESSELKSMETGSSSSTSKTRPRKIFHQQSGLGNQDPLKGVSSSSSESSSQVARSSSKANRYGLRNLRCNLISDVLPQGCSSETHTGKRDTVKNRNPGVESSSFVRGKNMSGPSCDRRVSLSTSGISISDFRQSRNGPPLRGSSAASVRTHKSINVTTRTGQSNRANGNSSSIIETSVPIAQAPQPARPINVNIPRSLHHIASSSRSSSSSHVSTDDDLPSLMSISSAELGINRLINRDGSRRYNMDGIAEVLLALERIEQDEELTYEQLHALETNLFLGGTNFYDEHRDMRLDIDNMSYEELLALEEKMGNVSTALSEEALSKCLRRQIHQSTLPEDSKLGSIGRRDDIRCSICQEEYVVGEELGMLGCEHMYHMVCIRQWLRLKNWCPICKLSLAA